MNQMEPPMESGHNPAIVMEFDEFADEPNQDKPYDPEKIRVDSKVFSIRQILDMIDDNELDIAPDFQRKEVWSDEQKSRLIESLLLRIPLPAFYFSSDKDGLLQVVDGVQRLSTIHNFVRKNGFSLSKLEYLNKFNGFTFKDLDSSPMSRRILGTQIAVNVIDPQTPAEVKFDIFRRINKNGTALNAQEIRHCISRARSRELLKSMSENPAFLNAINISNDLIKRMADRELVLRFVAFRWLEYDFEMYQVHKTLDDFLTHVTTILDNPKEMSKDSLESLKKDFANSMENVLILFGKHAFRKWNNNSDNLSPFNRSLFDAWSVALSRVPLEEVFKNKENIVQCARDMMTQDTDFIGSISLSTSKKNSVETRFRKVRDLLAECGVSVK